MSGVSKTILIAAISVAVCPTFAQSPSPRPAFDRFEVATITPTAPDWRGGAYFRMQGGHFFIVKNYSVHTLVAMAWNLPTHLVSGGPAWSSTDRYDIAATTPGALQPDRDEQMFMLRALLSDRFKLTFHREAKTLPVYELMVATSGPKINSSDGPPSDGRPALIFTLFPERRARLPVRDATMAEFASLLSHGAVDRPVVDKTGLTGRYDFVLDWAPDESDFDGMMRARPALAEDSAEPGLFEAVQQQLGLKLVPTRGPIETMVLDHVERPSDN
jgi:uncharacterized protein (TIGR03435 family)